MSIVKNVKDQKNSEIKISYLSDLNLESLESKII